MTYLCDTNIISELARPQPHPGVIAWSRLNVPVSYEAGYNCKESRDRKPIC